MNEPIEITDLASLKREKQRLQLYCGFQEERIKDKFSSITTNYKQIIGDEFLPFSTDINSKVSSAMDWVNDLIINKLLKINTGDGGTKGKITEAVIKFAEVMAVRMFSKFLKK